MSSNANTVLEAIVNLSSWNGLTLRFSGQALTARDIDGMVRPANRLVVRPVSTVLVKHGIKGAGTYIGVMPKGSTELKPTEKLEELVPELRIFFIGEGHDNEFTVCELEVADQAEVQEARERAARNAREREEEEKLKLKLHAYYEQLFSALATLSRRQRHELPRCDGNCERFTRLCPYNMEKVLRLCDDMGITITTVMMEVVTRTN